MARMIRKQFYIQPRQQEILTRRSRELDVTESEAVRRAIEQMEQPARDFVPDPKAWADFMAREKERDGIRTPQRPRTWTRDEIYEERFKRFSS